MSLVSAYKALSDESRLRILRTLDGAHLSVQDLTHVVQLTQPTVSHHLKILQQSGMVRAHRDGTWAFYSLARDGSIAAELAEQFLRVSKGSGLNGDGRVFAADEVRKTEVLDSRRSRSQRYFDSVASHWRELRDEAQGKESFFEQIRPLIGAEETLLEVGFGSGAFLEFILPRPGITIGVDASPAMVRETERVLHSRNLGADLRLGELEHLPVESKSVTVSVAYMMLHHLNDPQIALAELHRVTVPGGRLVIVDLFRHTNEAMRDRFADIWLGFEPEEIRHWLTTAGWNATQAIVPLGRDQAAFLLTSVKEKP